MWRASKIHLLLFILGLISGCVDDIIVGDIVQREDIYVSMIIKCLERYDVPQEKIDEIHFDHFVYKRYSLQEAEDVLNEIDWSVMQYNWDYRNCSEYAVLLYAYMRIRCPLIPVATIEYYPSQIDRYGHKLVLFFCNYGGYSVSAIMLDPRSRKIWELDKNVYINDIDMAPRMSTTHD